MTSKQEGMVTMLKPKLLALFLGGLVAGAAGWSYAQQSTPRGGTLTVADYIEIEQLYAAYNHVTDFSTKAEEWADLFTEDAENGPRLENGMRWGRQGLIDYFNFRQKPPRQVNRERHWNSNLRIKPTPEGAHGSVMFLLLRVGTPPTLVSTHTYEDDLVKTPQGWKFKKRVFAKGPGE